MDPEEVVGVRVPASSANLGPGFDALAVALDLPLIAWTTEREQRRVLAEGEGAAELPAGDDNVVWRAFLAYCAWAGTPPPDVSVRVRSAIPLQRGLGSSAAAAVAGVALARAVTRAGGANQDLIALAADLEGHTDNAAAAMLGGLCLVSDGRATRLEPSEALRPIVCIPRARQSTALARGLLPTSVPLAAAAANGARTAAVLAGLSGAMAWHPETMRDVLHEPSRLAAMAGSGALVRGLRAAGFGACLSGAGPSVLVIAPSGNSGARDRVEQLAGPGWTVRSLCWDRAGACVYPGTRLPLRE